MLAQRIAVPPPARPPARRVAAQRRASAPSLPLPRRASHSRSDALAPLLARAVQERASAVAAHDGPLLARKHGDTALGTLTGGQVSTWETHVRKGRVEQARQQVATMVTRDESHMIDLVLYKIGKHVAANPVKARNYIGSLPFDFCVKVLERAIVQDKPVERRRLLTMFSFMWAQARDQVIALVRAHPDAFLDTLVPELIETQNTQGLMTMAKDRGFLAALGDDLRARFVAAIPMLSTARAISARLAEEAGDGGQPNEADVATALFEAMINHEGIDVGYAATAVGLSAVALLDADAERQMLDCHRLTEVFLALLEGSPAITAPGTKIRVDEPLLTVPMSTLPGGLIPRTFTGNVVGDNGALTGQIFFSGALGMASHTYARFRGVDFDTLFGTTGGDVAGSVAARFDAVLDGGEAVDGLWRERGGAGRYIYKLEGDIEANVHGFASRYRLARDRPA